MRRSPASRASRRRSALLVAAAAITAPIAAGAFHVGSVAEVDAPGVRLAEHPRTLSILAVGDWLSENRMNAAAIAHAGPGERMNHTPLMAPIEPMIRSADLAICHMETPITAPGARYGWMGKASATGPNLIGAPFEVARDLARVGFDRCSTASNHSWDLGAPGIASTLEAFDLVGVTHVGTARIPEEAANTTFTVNGVRLAHLSYTRSSNTAFPGEVWRINRAGASRIASDATAIRSAGAELVIVSLHVSTEMLTTPTPDDRALVTALLAAARVDLVIVHGPHTVQPLEFVGATPVFWSLGNFVSGMGAATQGRYADPRTLDGLAAGVRFTERSDGTWLVEAGPVGLCQMFGSRVVYHGYAALADPTTPAPDQAAVSDCLQRSAPVVRDLR